ncbi:(Fe-S)-binding protein [Paenibacillus guangzhouensis]|uniref:(Fe-S)-binding protein n=1 Tax=Paenibacillus guangzhouensis TaxID=1473112 RepID=UPI001266D3BF|nr:(Fe-S)-binding protein [Paenibacillus guangzhouensis]
MAKTELQSNTFQAAPLTSKTEPACSSMANTLKLSLDYDQLTNCMRCGFCLPACPTFRETGVEAESPRGRIALMKAVVDGIMEPNMQFEAQMNHCLGCRACEPACPADVKYGQLIEQAREAVEKHTVSHRWWVKLARKVAFKGVFPYQNRVRMVGGALRFYQQSGLRNFVRNAGLMNLFPAHMRDMEKILPDASDKGVIESIGTRHSADGLRIATVGLFRGCIMDILFTETNINTVRLLTAAGFDVVIPETQNCCGALHAHSGEQSDAKELAKRNIRAFRESGVDWIISNAGGCGALLVDYGHLLHDDPDWREDAAWFASRTIDISKILADQGNLPHTFGSMDEEPMTRITYQESCHLRNVMRSSDAQRKLIRRVEGAEFVELFESDRCCGSAGIYNLTQPEMAGSILDHKMEHVKKTEAHVLLTSNPGCLLQMKHGIEKHGMSDRMQAMHVVDFLYSRLNRDKINVVK